ncbi:MAG: heat-inducible transcriptional repressor HrcA [Candidatus Nanopelagicales bacterium]
MSDERRLAVLRAIVEDFVASNEPVGSKSIAARPELAVSSATIRNDMAVLEDEGLIVQPHTSAGRVPTDAGYRVFVDRLAQVRPLSGAERRAIHTFLDSAVDLDNVVERAVKLLAQLTSQMALVQYPSLRRSHVRHIELVPVAPQRLLVVLIADSGRVEQRVVATNATWDEDVVARLRNQVNEVLHDREFADVADLTAGLADEFEPDRREQVAQVVGTLRDAAVEHAEERIVIAGTAHLARHGRDFPQTIQPVLEALEEQMVLLRLLGEATATDRIDVRIGHENDLEAMDAVSVVTSGYGPHDTAVAHLGVLGPTRMDYPGSITAVRAVARYLGRILADQ